MKTKNRTTKELRGIALGLIHGEIACDWKTEDCHKEVSLLSEIEHLILLTYDIGMRYEKYKNAFDKDEYGHFIFAAFQTLTKKEALQVAEMFLRYKSFIDTYVEVEISHV